MLCDNCGKNEAEIRITQIINGKKTEMMLCRECASEMGIASLDFEMPIDISNFLGDFLLEDENEEFHLPNVKNQLKCNKCGMSYDEFLSNGKFGCEECYKTFEDKINIMLKRIQGTDRYIGKKANNKEENKIEEVKTNNVEKTSSKLEELQKQLKDAIKEERYEDAAKIRDEIRKEGLQ